MTTVDYSPTIEQLEARIAQLETDNLVAERERDLALDAVQQQQQQLDSLTNQLEYTKLELNRVQSKEQESRSKEQESRQEAQKLQRRVKSIMAICAIPRGQMLPNTKLAWITGPEQVPYSDVLHGGQGEHMLTSMKQWNIAIGGNETNTNCLNEALKPLEEAEAITRERVELNDGRKHYEVKFDENMLNHARKFQKEGEPNKHNGGNKRCPQCKEYCKKTFKITYECEHCGIDYDRDMNPINHRFPEPIPYQQAVPTPTVGVDAPKPSNIVQFVPRELPMEDDEPLPDLLTEDHFNAFGPKKASR